MLGLTGGGSGLPYIRFSPSMNMWSDKTGQELLLRTIRERNIQRLNRLAVLIVSGNPDIIEDGSEDDYVLSQYVMVIGATEHYTFPSLNGSI